MSFDPKWGSASPFHDPAILAAFAPRSTDVLITTPPKAGTTWMQQILHQLRTGGDDSFRCIYDVVPWLELPRPGVATETVLAQYDAIADPRVFKTHCTFEQTPGADVARIVLTSRDPRDCCVSFYHHMMGLTDEMRATLGIASTPSFNQVFEQWLEFGAWYRNVLSWWPHRSDANVLWLRYEDMVNDLPSAIARLLAFLGWRLDQTQTAKVLHYCSFEWMRANSERFRRLSGEGKLHFKPGTFIRKGAVGDHKNLLSSEQEQRILTKAREMLKPDCLAFIGIPTR